MFALDVTGTRYTGDGRGWLLAGLEPGRYSVVGEPRILGRAEFRGTEILA